MIFVSNSNIAIAREDIKTTMLVSWYKYGKITASGQRFDPHRLTAAHKTLPFGTKLKLTNVETNKTIVVVVNDRGPYVKGRSLDITMEGAILLGVYKQGVSRLKVEIVD
jgi:rare lipoprotein A